LLFSLVLEIIKYDEKCLDNYLFKICQNPLDDRIIMRINGVWIINGTNKKIVNQVYQYIIKNNLMSHNNTEQFGHILFSRIDKYKLIKSKMDSYPLI
jgi:hypothetical protein